MGQDAMILVFWMLSFKPTFSLSSFTFIKRLFSSSSLSAIRVLSSAYLRILIFLPAILILACASSSPAFLTMYSAYKLNKQGDSIQPWCTPWRTGEGNGKPLQYFCLENPMNSLKRPWSSVFYKTYKVFKSSYLHLIRKPPSSRDHSICSRCFSHGRWSRMCCLRPWPPAAFK